MNRFGVPFADSYGTMKLSLLLASFQWLSSRFTALHFMQLQDELSGLTEDSQLNEILRPHFSVEIERQPDWWKMHRDQILGGQQQGYEFLSFDDIRYPHLLRKTLYPPTLLHFWGHPAWLQRPTLSVVGSRKLLSSNMEWMEQNFDSFLHKVKLCVVSGGARGADQKAHQIALWTHSPTVMVMPTGLHEIYPRQLLDWQEAVISGGGCFLSQFSPSQKMFKASFHIRNRVIVGLSHLLLVIQAARRSGSYLSARFAIEEGRDLAALPGSAHDESMLGSLDLLFDGAHMIRDSWDLVSLWNLLKSA